MDIKEVFKDKPRIIETIEALELNAKSDSPVLAISYGGVSIGNEEGPRIPWIITEAYRNLGTSADPEPLFAARQKYILEESAKGEIVPAQSPLEWFAEMAERRTSGSLTDQELNILDEACAYIPSILYAEKLGTGEDVTEQVI